MTTTRREQTVARLACVAADKEVHVQVWHGHASYWLTARVWTKLPDGARQTDLSGGAVSRRLMPATRFNRKVLDALARSVDYADELAQVVEKTGVVVVA